MLRAVLTTSLLLLPVPAVASTYSASLAHPTNGRIIGRDIVWSCGTDVCQGATDESRPAVICQSLVRQASRISSFLVDGRVFTPAELDKCNSAARVESSKALAAQ